MTATPTEAPGPTPVLDLDALEAFMNGTAALDGSWFGEWHNTEPGMFWWRKRLASVFAELRASRTALAALSPPPELVVVQKAGVS